MDIVMRFGEGVETIGKIVESKPDTPVIAISGHPEYLRTIAKLGAVATLQKPFKIKDLLGIIQEVTQT